MKEEEFGGFDDFEIDQNELISLRDFTKLKSDNPKKKSNEIQVPTFQKRDSVQTGKFVPNIQSNKS